MTLSIVNPQPQRLSGPSLLHQLVEQPTLNSLAIDHLNDDGSSLQLTYSQLHYRANRLARHIVKSSKTSSTTRTDRSIIPIFIAQCPDLYIAQLATLKAGCAFCPLPLDVPEERLKFILQDVGASLLITNRSSRHLLPISLDVTTLTVDNHPIANGHGDDEDRDVAQKVEPTDAAYVMYTSGSTGQPKGVILSHSAATQALLAHHRHIPQFSRFLQFASPTFDVSVFEIFFPWFRGSTLVSCDRRKLLNDLPAVMHRLQIDAAELTPSVASNLLRGRQSVPHLKVLLTIGEMLKPSVVQAYAGTSTEAGILHGMYGPTEATIHCTLQPQFRKDMSCGSIGQPLDTVSAFIVRPIPSDEPSSDAVDILPIEEEGELAIGGHQLADGYLNRPEQTNAAFVHHPEYGKLYRTGDRARLLQDGTLECLGRISSGQVKLRGQRIELGEVEHAVLRFSACTDAVAEVISGILVVFCVSSESDMNKITIQESCREWLPQYMIPGDVVILQSLPYLSSGKVDRKELRKTYAETQKSESASSNRYDQRTRDILDILGNIFDTDIDASSSLPAYGLDSLTAIRLTSELQKKGYPRLDAAQVLGARTTTEIASMLEAMDDDPSDRYLSETSSEHAELRALISQLEILAGKLDDVEDIFACTNMQSAMLTETHRQNDAYCNWIELLLPLRHSLQEVSSALQTLTQQHSLLRSGFVSVPEHNFTYANVIWKSLAPEQIIIVDGEYDRSFLADDDSDLLRPINFQLSMTDSGVGVLIRLHHALYDQWSVDILRKDLALILDDVNLPPSPSFISTATYHRRYLTGCNMSQDLDFWHEYLLNYSVVTLPQMQKFKKPPRLRRTPWTDLSLNTRDLQSSCKTLSCSAPAALQASLALLLSLYTGSSDVVFGSVFSGRTIAVPNIEEVFGPCLLTLPLRVDLTSVQTALDLLAMVNDRNRAIQKHALTPLTNIKQAANIRPGVQLFDTLFVWQESTLRADEHEENVKVVDSQDQLEFQLVLEFEPSATCVKARATYDESRLDGAQLEILLQQIDSLTRQIISSPSTMVEALPEYLPPSLQSISNPEPDYLSNSLDLNAMLEARSKERPAESAILFAHGYENDELQMQSISYADFNAKVNQTAHLLISKGVQPEDVVCICMEKCIELYITILATIRAGAGYLPLIPETPKARIESILAQAKTEFCVCDDLTMRTMKDFAGLRIINALTSDLVAYPSSSPRVPQSTSRIAYAVFTSGSTGEPKGVAVTLQNLHGNLATLSELYSVKTGDKLLQACSQAFDVSVFEIFFAFYSGMCLCSGTKDTLFRDLEFSIRSFGVTHLSLTPTIAALIAPVNVPSVKFLVTAGEGVTDKVHKLWAGHGLNQGYGPSETTNICTVNMSMPPSEHLGSIGPPFRNTSAFVVATQGEFRILPAGSHGEYAFGGEQVFRGYIGRDDLNAAKLIDHPKYGRVYRSGDMGRILPDGTLFISGRLDDQVKIRGNRVELGEINAILMQQHAVFDCATILLGKNTSEQILVSFVVLGRQGDSEFETVAPESVEQKDLKDLFDALEQSTPTYMHPSFIVPVKRLPSTSQGKLDKRLLERTFNELDSASRDLLSKSSEQFDGDEEELDSVEREIAQKLSDTLQIPMSSISKHSSFFALGLNSLNAIALAKALTKDRSRAPGISVILQNPSVYKLAKWLSQSSRQVSPKEGRPNLSVFPQEFVNDVHKGFQEKGQLVETILPCTPLQEAMLSIHDAQNLSSYCTTVTLDVRGDLDRLQSSLTEMFTRHAILRTSFVPTPSAAQTFCQVVLKNFDSPFKYMKSLSNGNSITNGHVAEAASSQKVSPLHPIVIEVETWGKKALLQVHMHHAIYDGSSMSTLFAEIEQVYRGETLPPAVPLEPFLEAMIAHNSPPIVDFWSPQFSDFKPHPIFEQGAAPASSERIIRRCVAHNVTDLNDLCEKYGLTPLSVLQAAWVKTLATVQSLDDLCFGNVVSGRSIAVPDLERLVAPCFNTIPMRVKVGNIGSNIELTRELHKRNVNCLDYQLTGLRRIQPLSKFPSIHLFDTLLLVQAPQMPLDSKIWELEGETGTMGLPLVIEVTPRESTLYLDMHLLDSVMEESLAESLADAFVSAYLSCVRFPSNRIGHFLDFDSSAIQGKLKPKLANGPGAAGDIPNDDNKESWTPEEDVVRKVYAEISSVDERKIRPTTSLYQIGLDSLNAVQVAARLRSAGWTVNATDVMLLMTPAKLAALATDKATDRPTETEKFDFAAFEARHRPQILQDLHLEDSAIQTLRPCVSIQSGMIAQSLHSNGDLYLNHLAYRIPQETPHLDAKAAWEVVQQKHEILRMGFCHLQDGVAPFGMLIYKSDGLPKIPFQFSKALSRSTDFDSIASAAAGSIMRELHLPCWRVMFSHEGDSILMHLIVHHALYDADALRLLLADFWTVLQKGMLSTVPSIDSVVSTMIQNSLDNRAEAEAFWKETLSMASVTKFPNLTPKIEQRHLVRTQQMTLSVGSRALESWCREHSVTIQAIGQSVWASLLAAYLGETNVTFGTVFAGHRAYSQQKVAFPSVATIPVCCNVSSSLVEVAEYMVSYNASAQKNRFTSLSDIQRLANRPGQALFDTVFVYQRSTVGEEPMLPWDLVHETAAVDYTVSVELETPLNGELQVRLSYDIKSVPEAHATLLLEQYDMLLSQLVGDTIASDPEKKLMSLLPPKVNAIPSTVVLLHQFVEKGARDHPHRPALEFITALTDSAKSRKTWTYEQLNRRANQVAHMIREHGIPQGSVVAVCMEKSAEATFAFIGILKAGCAFLAMDPDLPLARRSFILGDSCSRMLFVTKGSKDTELPSQVMQIELVEDGLDEFPDKRLGAAQITSDATCYCLYTSGTTGTPKGCEITHENAVQAMMSFQRLFAGRWNSSSRWLQFASYWFDVSILEQFWSWSTGITLVGAPRDLVLEDLAAFIRTAQITHIDLTPSLARLLAPADVPSLCGGVFITGGEALKQEIIDAWGRETTICNGYGPTEATIGVTMNPFIGVDDKPSNIGPQFDNVGSYVFRPGTDNPVLRGAVGELCVSGKLVGKGYLNRPDLTEKAFPFLERFSERVYRTGDLVRMLADGSFSFIGRQDTQAKLRGQRLEIEEIDTIIKTSATETEISDVTSLVIKANDTSRETLISFITSGGDRKQELALQTSFPAIRMAEVGLQACRDRLPPYMVPTHIIPLSYMPLTVNNKVDSKRLVALYHSLTPRDLQVLQGHCDKRREANTAERKIIDTVCQLLSISSEDVLPTSNLFSLGLSSISAIPFASMLRKAGFENIDVASVMHSTTIERLAKKISHPQEGDQILQNAIRQSKLSLSAFAQRYRGVVAQSLSLADHQIESVAPCSPLQTGLLIESSRSEKRTYFNHFQYDVTALDTSRLITSLEKLYARLPILRTAFVRTDDGFAQAVLTGQTLALHRSPFKDAGLDDLLTSWRYQDIHDSVMPFEVVVSEDSQSKTLTMFTHHALYDGISWDLMMRQLAKVYNGHDIDDGSPNFIQALPYGPLCHRPDAENFWKGLLEGTRFTPLSPGTGKDVVNSIEADHVVIRRLDDISNLEAVRKDIGVSPQAVFQACFDIALHQLAPQTQSYGTVVSGRSIALEHADTVIGPLFNTLPHVLALQPKDSWAAYLRRGHDRNAALIPFQHTPLRDIRRFSSRPPSDPLFDVLFVFQYHNGETSLGAEGLFEELPTQTVAEYPLALEVELDQAGAVEITAVAQAGRLTEGHLELIIENFVRAMDCMMQNIEGQIEDSFTVNIERHESTTELAGDRNPKVVEQDGTNFTWTENAKTLRHVVADLAGCEEKDIEHTSSIFSLGLDSIDVVKLVSRLKRAGVVTAVSQVLKAQTITGILDTIKSEQPVDLATQSVNTLRVLEEQLQDELDETSSSDIERILPASPGQEALVAEMIKSDYREYFNHDVLRLRQDVDLERLKEAWQEVIDASPILRTRFVGITRSEVDAVFAQIVIEPLPFEFEEAKISAEDELPSLMQEITKEVMTWSSSRPPFRVTFVKGQSDQLLVLSLAHALYDGHSLALLHEDVARAYHESFQVRPAIDQAIELSLRAVSDSALKFWRTSLSGAKVSLFNAKATSQESQVHRAEHISSSPSRSAQAFCQQLGVTMQSLIHTAWALLLAHHTRSLDVIFGVVLACRDSEELEQILFPTMNTVPIRASLHGSCHQMIKYMQDLANDLRPYQRTPLRRIQNACSGLVRRDPKDTSLALFDSLLVYQHRPDVQEEQYPALYESIQSSADIEYPVAVEVESLKGNLVLRAACKGNVFDEHATQMLLKKFDEVLGFLINSSGKPVVELTEDNHASICGLPAFMLDSPEFQPPSQPSDPTGAVPEAPSPVTDSIRAILASVANVALDDVTADSSIESIGIDSISAIKVAALLRKEKIPLRVTDLLRSKTPRAMANLLEQDQPQAPERSEQTSTDVVETAVQQVDLEWLAKHVDMQNVETILPASAGQAYMLAMWMRTKGQLFFPEFTYQILTEKTIDEMRLAWEKVFAHLPILRTGFLGTDIEHMPLLQVVSKPSQPVILVEDEELNLEQRRDAPLVVIRISKIEHGFQMRLTIHHALYDAVSLPLIIDTLSKAINNKPLDHSSISMRDFLALSHNPSTSQTRQKFWTNYLSSCQPFHLPFHSHPTSESSKLSLFTPSFLPSFTPLSALARSNHISPQAILFAAFAKTYASHLCPSSDHSDRERDVVMGIYLSNRIHLDGLPSLAAPTLSLVPLRCRNPLRTSLLDLARTVHADLARIAEAAHAGVSLEEIRVWSGVVLDVFVNFIAVPDGVDSSAGKEDAAVIMLEEGERLAPRATMQDPTEKEVERMRDFEEPRNLKKWSDREAYQPAFDVEFSVSDDALHMGVFGFGDMVDLSGVQSALDELRRMLNEAQ